MPSIEFQAEHDTLTRLDHWHHYGDGLCRIAGEEFLGHQMILHFREFVTAVHRAAPEERAASEQSLSLPWNRGLHLLSSNAEAAKRDA
jgi:hypothetical protein